MSPVIGLTLSAVTSTDDLCTNTLDRYVPEGATESEWKEYVCRMAVTLTYGYGLPFATATTVAIASALPEGYSVMDVRDAYASFTGKDAAPSTVYTYLMAAVKAGLRPSSGMNGVIWARVDPERQRAILERQRAGRATE